MTKIKEKRRRKKGKKENVIKIHCYNKHLKNISFFILFFFLFYNIYVFHTNNNKEKSLTCSFIYQ